ncbi:hypothetical protein L1049_008761 [Liquidambar formosana]|uniref:Uncharacterized protein n=1 Tax=Liquidambar formosana TaxID=63359 RepID=A0AAP0X9I7_LIQFO
MDPENLDWNNIESIFAEDDTYEHINAPKWIDLSALDDPVVDDAEAWFCKPDCRHPKTVEDFQKLTRNWKVKFLRSVTIAEILPFRERKSRAENLKRRESDSLPVEENIDSQLLKTKGLNSPTKFDEDNENHNPNFSTPLPNSKSVSKKATANSRTTKKKQLDDSHANSSQKDGKPRLRSTFSARNLFAGREILSQITEFCNEMKKLGRKNSKKGSSSEEFSGRVSGSLKESVGDRERMPLLVAKE